jgi:hypothetical protein
MHGKNAIDGKVRRALDRGGPVPHPYPKNGMLNIRDRPHLIDRMDCSSSASMGLNL